VGYKWFCDVRIKDYERQKGLQGSGTGNILHPCQRSRVEKYLLAVEDEGKKP
jgi:PHP family Zn ribbon phosphoesterase